MKLAFDTSILIAVEKKDKKVLSFLKSLSDERLEVPAISFIVHFEFIEGIKRKNPKNSKKLLEFLNKFPLLEAGRQTSNILSDLKTKYDKQGLSFSLTDFLIASQAIENGMTLITMDKDFEGIEELKKIII